MKIKTTILSVLAAAVVCASPLSVSAENLSALTPEEEAGVLAEIEKANASEGTYIGALTLDDIEMLDSEDQAKFNMDSIEESDDPNAPLIMSEIINSDKDDIDVSNVFKITGYNANDAYKRYNLEYFMITEYKDNPDFKALIQENDDPRIMLPSDRELVELCKKDDGSYEISGGIITSDIPKFNALTESIINSLNEDVLNVVHTYSDSYYMDIIYIETAQNEYAVPYFDFSKMLYFDPGDRLVSGTVYTVAEFMDRMDQSYTENFYPSDSDGGSAIEVKEYAPYVPSAMATANKAAQTPVAAATSTEDPSVFSTAILITSAVIFLSFLTAIVVFNRKKHRQTKKPEA